jgi:hypothetical protein
LGFAFSSARNVGGNFCFAFGMAPFVEGTGAFAYGISRMLVVNPRRVSAQFLSSFALGSSANRKNLRGTAGESFLMA